MKKIFFLILAMAFCSLGFAQDNQNGRSNKQDRKEKFEQMMADIQSRKIAFLTKHLKLTSEIRKSAWALHKAVKEGNASDEEIKSLADTYYENLDRESSLQKLHYYEYLKVLPVKKAAMVRMVEERFMNELLSQWRRQPRPNGKEQNK